MKTKLKNVREVSEYLGVKPPRTYELARLWEAGDKHGLPCVRLGQRQLRFFPDSVERYLKNLENLDLPSEEVSNDD